MTKNTAADWNTARDIHPARSVHSKNLFSQSLLTSDSESFPFLSSFPVRQMAKGGSRVKARLYRERDARGKREEAVNPEKKENLHVFLKKCSKI